MSEIIIDEPTKKLLDGMGFVENPTKKNSYQIRIDNGLAGVTYDAKNPDGYRWAKIGGKFLKHNELDEKVPILKTFKERRDLLQSSSTEQLGEATSAQSIKETAPINKKLGTPDIKQPESQNNKQDSQKTATEGGTLLQNETSATNTTPKGVQTAPPPKTSNEAQQPNPPAASQSPNLYGFFSELVGAGGIIEVFGDTGSLKSQLCTETCKDAKKLGKTFFYLDTEGKVGLRNKKTLGDSYRYLPVWTEIVAMLTKDLPKYDLFIVDSIGFPISTEYADMKANEQGGALQDMMAVVGKHLKAWAFKNNAIVIFTNQPKSAFMKSDEELNRLNPFGDKVHFAANIILRSVKTIIPGHLDPKTNKIIPVYSIATFTSHRSTDFADDRIMFLIHKNDDGVKVEITDYVTKRLQELKE